MISATILTKNSARHLDELLESLNRFDEVLIYDNGSQDSTMEIANKHPNCRIVEGPFLGFGPTHNKASSLAKNDWILSIESDEIPTKELLEELHSLKLDPQCIYSIPRKNLFNGKWIYSCGWWPDRVVRLYNRKSTQFTNALVHESVEKGALKEEQLKSPLKHYSYDSLSDFLRKMESYSTLFAEGKKGKTASSPLKAVLHGWCAFFKSYILKRGFMQGYEGFLISKYNSQTAFWKYMKLYQLNNDKMRL
jgi:glycosyltransferase involved in cell wall biosynthesis